MPSYNTNTYENVVSMDISDENALSMDISKENEANSLSNSSYSKQENAFLIDLRNNGISDEEKYITIFQSATYDNDIESLKSLGNLYNLDFEATPENGRKAFSYYLQAAQCGDIDSCLTVGLFYECGIDPIWELPNQEDQQRAVEYFYRVINNPMANTPQRAEAWLSMGNLHYYDPIKQNFLLGTECWKKAIKLNPNETSALVNLGQAYRYGHGVPIDYKRCFELNKRAAELGYPLGYENIAFLYERGMGVPINYTMALRCYLRAASGSPIACIGIGLLISRGVVQLPCEQRKNINDVDVDDDDDDDFYYLLRFKEYCQSINIDPPKTSRHWFRVSCSIQERNDIECSEDIDEQRSLAKQGDFHAQLFMGILHAFGLLQAEPNLSLALHYLKSASDKKKCKFAEQIFHRFNTMRQTINDCCSFPDYISDIVNGYLVSFRNTRYMTRFTRISEYLSN